MPFCSSTWRMDPFCGRVAVSIAKGFSWIVWFFGLVCLLSAGLLVTPSFLLGTNEHTDTRTQLRLRDFEVCEWPANKQGVEGGILLLLLFGADVLGRESMTDWRLAGSNANSRGGGGAPCIHPSGNRRPKSRSWRHGFREFPPLLKQIRTASSSHLERAMENLLSQPAASNRGLVVYASDLFATAFRTCGTLCAPG